jgi:ParB-like chromosome segregation protein Spo0J
VTVVDVHQVPIDKIDVTGRIRGSVGDVTTLADSIATIGLLNPLVVTPDLRLVAGERRLEALRKLGRQTAPVTYLDFDSVAKLAIAERDENTERVPFTREEQIRAAMRIEEALKPAARERQRQGAAMGGKRLGSLRQAQHDLPVGPTAQHAAAAVGISRATYETGKTVVKALDEAPDELKPELRLVVDEMNETGKVNTAARKAREITGDTKPKKPGPKRVPGSASHREAWHRFDKAWGSFTHSCQNAVDMPVPDDVTPERMAQMLHELEGCITGINQLRKRLREAIAS